MTQEGVIPNMTHQSKTSLLNTWRNEPDWLFQYFHAMGVLLAACCTIYECSTSRDGQWRNIVTKPADLDWNLVPPEPPSSILIGQLLHHQCREKAWWLWNQPKCGKCMPFNFFQKIQQCLHLTSNPPPIHKYWWEVKLFVLIWVIIFSIKNHMIFCVLLLSSDLGWYKIWSRRLTTIWRQCMIHHGSPASMNPCSLFWMSSVWIGCVLSESRTHLVTNTTPLHVFCQKLFLELGW